MKHSFYSRSLLLVSVIALSIVPLAPPVSAADYTATVANVVKGANAKTRRAIAGATLLAGQPVYLDPSDSFKAKLVDANASLAAATVEGVTLHGALAGQPIEYDYDDDDFTPGFTMAVGDILIASATPGAIAPAADLAAGYFGTVLGVAKSTTKMRLKLIAAGAVKV